LDTAAAAAAAAATGKCAEDLVRAIARWRSTQTVELRHYI